MKYMLLFCLKNKNQTEGKSSNWEQMDLSDLLERITTWAEMCFKVVKIKVT